MSGHAWPPLDDGPVRGAGVGVGTGVGVGVGVGVGAYQAAPLWRRSFATLIDLAVPATLWVLGTWALLASDPEPLELPPWNLFDQIVDYLHDRPGRAFLSLTLFIGLQIAWPLAFAGRTPGKRALDVVMLAGDGRRPGAGRLLLWALWRIPSLALAGLGAWWALLDPERRTLHDRLARVWLVHDTDGASPGAHIKR